MKNFIKQTSGILEFQSNVELLEQIKIGLHAGETIVITGPAGTGKTVLFEELAKDESMGIDELIIFRLQGLGSEDFRLPMVDRKIVNGVEERTISFANVGIFDEIAKNPDKKYLLFFDEVNRASRDIAPLLFSFFEKKFMDGKRLDNCFLVAAINIGDEYETIIDFTDKALRRRVTFMGMNPCIEDFRDFLNKKGYHRHLQEISQWIDKEVVFDYSTVEEYEQTTNFGSFAKIDSRWKHIEKVRGSKLTLDDCLRDLTSFGSMYLSGKSRDSILKVIQNLIETTKVDIHKELICKDWIFAKEKIYDTNGAEIKDPLKREAYYQFAILNFLKSKLANDLSEGCKYIETNIVGIFRNFQKSKTLLMSLLNKTKSTDVNDIVENTKYRTEISKSLNTAVNSIKNNPKATEEDKAMAIEFFDECRSFFTIIQNSNNN